MSEKRHNDPEHTKQIVFKAAEELFIEKGFSATSMSQISKKAEVTQSLIHHHFGSKKDLWNTIKTTKMKSYFDIQMDLLAANNDNATSLLEESLTSYFNFFRKNPEIVRLMLWDRLEQNCNTQSECGDAGYDVFSSGVEKLKVAQSNGTLRSDIAAENILSSFLFLIEGWFQQKSHIISHLKITSTENVINQMDEKYLSDIIKLFLTGIKK